MRNRVDARIRSAVFWLLVGSRNAWPREISACSRSGDPKTGQNPPIQAGFDARKLRRKLRSDPAEPPREKKTVESGRRVDTELITPYKQPPSTAMATEDEPKGESPKLWIGL